MLPFSLFSATCCLVAHILNPQVSLQIFLFIFLSEHVSCFNLFNYAALDKHCDGQLSTYVFEV